MISKFEQNSNNQLSIAQAIVYPVYYIYQSSKQGVLSQLGYCIVLTGLEVSCTYVVARCYHLCTHSIACAYVGVSRTYMYAVVLRTYTVLSPTYMVISRTHAVAKKIIKMIIDVACLSKSTVCVQRN